ADDSGPFPNPLLRPLGGEGVPQATRGRPAALRIRRSHAPAPRRPRARAGDAVSASRSAHAGTARVALSRQGQRAALESVARWPHRPHHDALLARAPGPRPVLGHRIRRALHRPVAPLLRRLREGRQRPLGADGLPAPRFPRMAVLAVARLARRAAERRGGREQLHAGVPRFGPAHAGGGRGLPGRLGRPPRVQLRHGRVGARPQARRPRRRRRVHARVLPPPVLQRHGARHVPRARNPGVQADLLPHRVPPGHAVAPGEALLVRRRAAPGVARRSFGAGARDPQSGVLAPARAVAAAGQLLARRVRAV
ncbi:MAG: hypothetical protein AVDCRST_MAG08-1367, partial [uncultured Acetobacteraceae bacterium]